MRSHLAFVLAVTGALATAQSNTIQGLGIRLADLDALTSNGRSGVFPNGSSGLSCALSACNNGSVPVNWLSAMQTQHPFYAFLLCRETAGRLLQISDHSFVKHGFASLNGDLCGSCQQPPGGGAQLGVNCSDTYGFQLNSDPYDLGPTGEIDPWLMTWTSVGSQFDRGEPPVAGAAASDNVRSLTAAMVTAMGPVRHRIEVGDADLDVASSQFYLQGSVWVGGETEGARTDNMLCRQVSAVFSAGQWVFTNHTAPVPGSVLQLWQGASVWSSTNGTSDGRVYVGVKVTELGNGLWHYDYAAHNRDNSRGIAAFRVPKCAGARVFNLGFHDVDADPLNDWSTQVLATEIAFLATAANALEWNSVFSFWFDSDAAPVAGTTSLDQARVGAGALSIGISGVNSPLYLGTSYVGAGCGAPAPTIAPAGAPALPRLGNATFGVRIRAHPGSGILVIDALAAVAIPLGPCTQYLGGSTITTWGFAITDANGTYTVPLAIPNDPSIEGLDVTWQAAELLTGGPLFGAFNLTNGITVRVGNNRGC
ncbi:MAG TPA: hypothetical protein VK348_02295 [Planctomycetota bacterium]|nr:hypothetical protein [Planctomycetota bacterium]